MEEQIHSFCYDNNLEKGKLIGILNNCLNHIATHMLNEVKQDKHDASTQTEVSTQSELSQMTNKQLKELCQQKGIKNVSGLNKDNLIKKLKGV